jgi:ornithine decarboxylase
MYYEALNICKKAKDTAYKMGIQIEIIDIGGGYPGIDKKISFEEIAVKIKEGINDLFGELVSTKKIKFIAEPGRYFAQKTHILVLNVIGKKKIINDNNEEIIIYYLNDGIYGSFNCIYFDGNSPTILPFNERDGKLHKSIIFGPTCDSIDLITDNIMLPELAIGEWIYVENFGAYTIAASSWFNGFKTTICKYIYRT